jgi:hypothetical protein
VVGRGKVVRQRDDGCYIVKCWCWVIGLGCWAGLSGWELSVYDLGGLT